MRKEIIRHLKSIINDEDTNVRKNSRLALEGLA
jgi:hypothetical protein